MYISKVGIPAEVHDTLVRNHPLCNSLRLSSQARVRDNWGSEIVGVCKKDTLVTSSLALIKPLPTGLTILYTPRGPIMDYINGRLVNHLMVGLKRFDKKERALFIKMDPAVRYQDFHLGEEHQPHAEATVIIETLEKAGAKYQGLTMDMGTATQPRFQTDIYREGFSEEQLSKGTKEMIRTAEKKGAVVQQGHVDFVDEFEKVTQSTMERQRIPLWSSGYSKKLLNIYPEDSFIMLAQVSLKERLDSTRQRHDKSQKDLSSLEENQMKKRHDLRELSASLTRELRGLEENITEVGEIVAVAGALAVTSGPTSKIPCAGLDDRYKRYMSTCVTWRNAVQECSSRGRESCSMGGLEDSLNDSLIKFKANFNSTINESIGEFDLPANKLLFKASEYAYKL